MKHNNKNNSEKQKQPRYGYRPVPPAHPGAPTNHDKHRTKRFVELVRLMMKDLDDRT